MSTPLLATKLYTPPPRPNLVDRSRLIAQLNNGLADGRKLTLISASAGFGKTTLMSEWLANANSPVAWLSLDENDSDTIRFLSYFIAALQTIFPDVGTAVFSALQSPQPPPIQAILTNLLNDLATISEPFILVLDDYHSLDKPEIDNALTFVLDHQPPQLHLVVATREDPALPLPRLRARGRLTELRAADLRFTLAETAVFLNQIMGLQLSADNIAALESRTEGWAAGLQLAALAMHGDADAAQFVKSFSGSHHFILDYLLEEVLQQQPEHVQTFLLHTAILDRFCGDLCSAVLDDPNAQATLETIQQANLFIVPLDSERRWFRYHHLFADLLKQHAAKTAVSPTTPLEVRHLRASRWFEANGWPIDAFQHAATANDIDRTIRLIEGQTSPLYFQGITRPIIKWLNTVPLSIKNQKPLLWIIHASALTLSGQPTSQIEEKLQAAEATLQSNSLAEQHDLNGRIAAIRAMLAITTNNIEVMLAQADTALAYLHPDNTTFLATVNMSIGYAHLQLGDLAAAQKGYHETVAYGQASHNTTFTLAGFIGLGNIQEAQNQLYQAEATYQHVLKLAGDPPLPYVCAAYLGLTQISYEWGDWAAVEAYGRQGIRFGLQLPAVDVPAAIQVFFARAKLAQNDIAAAKKLLDEAEQSVHQNGFHHQLPEIIEARIQLFLHQGNHTAATHLAQTHKLPLRLAQIQITQGETAVALNTLQAIPQQPSNPLKVVALTAVAHYANGNKQKAIEQIQHALAIAAEGGHVRTFVEMEPYMAALLRDAHAQAIMPDIIAKLLPAFATPSQPTSPIAQPLLDPLTPREIEVLHLIAQGHSNREISQRLFLALDTVKGHNRKIFGKLHVKRRTEAVARARELGLL